MRDQGVDRVAVAPAQAAALLAEPIDVDLEVASRSGVPGNVADMPAAAPRNGLGHLRFPELKPAAQPPDGHPEFVQRVVVVLPVLLEVTCAVPGLVEEVEGGETRGPRGGLVEQLAARHLINRASSSDLRPPETFCGVIVVDADRLHPGVHDRPADELE